MVNPEALSRRCVSTIRLCHVHSFDIRSELFVNVLAYIAFYFNTFGIISVIPLWEIMAQWIIDGLRLSSGISVMSVMCIVIDESAFSSNI